MQINITLARDVWKMKYLQHIEAVHYNGRESMIAAQRCDWDQCAEYARRAQLNAKIADEIFVAAKAAGYIQDANPL